MNQALQLCPRNQAINALRIYERGRRWLSASRRSLPVALALVLSLITVWSSDAAVVAVFDDPLYVDTRNNQDAESDNVQAGAQSFGLVAESFTNLLTASNYLRIIIPEQEVAPLARDLTSEARASLSNFVFNGGELIVHGSSDRSAASLLNAVFGFSVVELEDISGSFTRGADSTGTAFSAGAAVIPANNASTVLIRSSLPPGSRNIYTNASGSSVVLIEHGYGFIVFLGWDWWNASPVGTQNGGWLGVLQSALFQSSLPPRAPTISSQPSSRIAIVGNPVSFSVSVAGSMPLSVQWQKDGTNITGATDSVYFIPNAQSNLIGNYSVVVTNLFGSVTSSIARLTVVSSNAVVAVFDDPIYVDTANSTNSESDNVQAGVQSFGLPIVTFTNFLTVTNYLRIIIPEQENGQLWPALGVSGRAALSNYVFNGGTLIVHGTPGGFYTATLLNFVFGFTTVERSSSSAGIRSADAIGTEFANDLPTLGNNNATSALLHSSLPQGARGIYTNTAGDVVALIEYGNGRIVFLGWDWYDARPFGAQDSGWIAALESAVLQGPLPPRPPTITQQPNRQSVVVGASATFSVSAVGTMPLAYQWRKDGTNIPNATNIFFTISSAQNSNLGSYSVIITNLYGSAISSNATLTLLPAGFLVAIFDNSTYVDSIGGSGSESDNLQATVQSLGFPMTTFTDLLTGAGLYRNIIIPKQENRAIAPDLSAAARSAMSNFVFTGGRLIVHGTSTGSGATLINAILGLSIQETGTINPSTRGADAGGTEFADDPLTVPSNDSTTILFRNTLPAGALNLYTNLNGSAATMIRWGSGFVAFLGWDWFNAAPVGTQDSGWLTLLQSALLEPASCSNCPPVIIVQPGDRVGFIGGNMTFSVSTAGSTPLSYQWRKDGTNVPNATNSTYTIVNLQPDDAVGYSVLITNLFGSVASSNVFLSIAVPPPAFQILALLTSNSRVVDHNALTGDDRGGIAASSNRVVYTGDSSSARFLLTDLSGGTALGTIYDALVSDLRSGTIYSLANGALPLTSSGGVANALLMHDPITGLLNGSSIALSAPINLTGGGGGVGIFAGYGQIVIHSGSRVYSIALPSGAVTDLGAMTTPPHTSSESWAYWGVAEYVGGAYYLVCVRDSQTIVRTAVPTGATTNLAVFAGLSDMAAFTVSVPLNRWYFHYEGSAQFGGTSETIGYADAVFDVQTGPLFAIQPTNQTVVSGTNVTLVAAANGTGTVRYQWRFEGTNIAGATNATYTFTNASLSAQGNYSVVTLDNTGTNVSQNAFITVLILPVILTQPQSQTVLQGQTAIFSIVATGAPPLTYRWTLGGLPYSTTSVPFLILEDCQFSRTIRVTVTNLTSGPGGVNSTAAQLTVLSDFDQDGMADVWEAQYGFDTNNVADALLDFDGDRMLNRDEYTTGTDPTDPLSVLQLAVTITNSAVLEFVAQSNIPYRIQFRTNLFLGAWSNFTSIGAQPQARTVQVNTPVPAGSSWQRYFRVMTSPIP